MLRTAVIAILVLWPLVTRADVGVGLRRVPFQVTLTVDREYPSFEFFVVDLEPTKARPVSLTPSSPLTLRPEDKRREPFYVQIYVVPKSELSKLGQAVPPASWFEQKEHVKYYAGAISVRGFLDVFDNRERIERTYLIRSTADGFQLELLTENRGKPRAAMWAWGAICCGLPLMAVAVTGWFVVRLAYRKARNRGNSPRQ